MDNEHLVSKHNEDTKKLSEKFFSFLKICKKYLTKIRIINKLLNELEKKDIKSIIDNKNKIYKDINKIINEFDCAVNNPKLVSEMTNFQFENILLEKLDDDNGDDINKIFNFIDHLGKLETNNHRLIEQNEILSKKLKNEVLKH